MIPFASQRANGQDLATHLQNAYDNEQVEVAHLRGAIADNLHGAFKEWEIQADTLTKCQKYLYSLSINPDPAQGPLTRGQYMDYIDRTEKALGLGGQPRAVVFHTKYGREHCHVVWSRIDAENQKAVHLAFDYEKLMRVTRSFARDHGLSLPEGYTKSRHVGQIPLYELERERWTGMSKADHQQHVTDAWRQSDSPGVLVKSLAERGYMLAAGKRNDYMLVDLYGGIRSLSRMIADKSIRVKDLRDFFGKELPLESLPSVAEAEKLVETHRNLIERGMDDDLYADKLAELEHSQQERRRGLEKETEALRDRQHILRLSHDAMQRSERNSLRRDYLAKMKATRRAYEQSRSTGLAAFLGKVTGVNLFRQKLHRYQSAKATREHLEQRSALKTRQAQERQTFALRLVLQKQALEQKIKSFERIDRRELSALTRDCKRAQRIRARGEDEMMPSLVKLMKQDSLKEMPDLVTVFEAAKQAPCKDTPDLMAAFERAVEGYGEDRKEGDSGNSFTYAQAHEKSENEHNRGRDY